MPAQQEAIFVSTEAEIHRAERTALGVAPDTPLAALCLSGGGIRSAAFCLGAIQALARRKLLTQFHYLSTVSGGGYVGGWLTRCISETAESAEAAGQSDIVSVQESLCRTGRDTSEELENLRHYTNFLLPHSGLASDDSWAGLVLWTRNTLINWMVFFPLLLATAAVPVAYFAAVCAMGQAGDAAIPAASVTGAIGLVFLGIAVLGSCVDLPSHLFPDTAERTRAAMERQGGRRTLGLGSKAIHRKIVIWALLWTVIVPLSYAPLMHVPEIAACGRGAFLIGPDACPAQAAQTIPAPQLFAAVSDWHLAALPALEWLACMIAYGLARRAVWIASADALPAMRDAQMRPFWVNLPAWMFSSFVSSSLLWAGACLADGHSAAWLAIAGPPWVVLAEVVRSGIYVAFRKDGLRSDLDREWLARLSATKIRPVFAYGLIALAAILLPRLVLDTDTLWSWLIAAAGFASGPVAALLGKSGLTSAIAPTGSAAKAWSPSLNLIVGCAVGLFAAAMLMLAGRLDERLVLLATDAGAVPMAAFWKVMLAAVLLAACGGGIAYGIGDAVNLNRFSMHALYRNRLVRAFLGSARPRARRNPDAFTGFDPRDDVRMADTFRDRVTKRLFPVVNVALNRTHGADTARAERKAESFTITPLHCGSPGLANPRTAAGPHQGAYVATEDYAGDGLETGPEDGQKGIRLGTAITISGAAASPDMGYLSSPTTAFVMTLFNVRLGAWLPNPAAGVPTRALMRSSGPRNAVSTLLDELAGRSGVAGDFVYLSDGGHFDNLGLYEMLRRRCAQIVVIDAGHDPDYGYFDLGRTLQHASIDMGVQVDFLRSLVIADKALQASGAFARITYPDEAAGSGYLLYLKPWMPPDAAAPLQAFKAANPQFPHETTLNQFFTESDFESYRALGDHIANAAFAGAVPAPDGLGAVFRDLIDGAVTPEISDADLA